MKTPKGDRGKISKCEKEQYLESLIGIKVNGTEVYWNYFQGHGNDRYGEPEQEENDAEGSYAVQRGRHFP